MEEGPRYHLQVKSYVKLVFVYMRGGLARLDEISLFSTWDLAYGGGAGNFTCNCYQEGEPS